MSGGGGDAGGRVGCVQRPTGLGSASAGGVGLAGLLAPGAGGGSPIPRLGRGRAAPPSSSGEGKLTLSSRLGSLTQIRHDKEGESGTYAEAQAWAEPSGGGCR